MEIIECDHQDLPVTFCSKCKTFFVLDKEFNRTEIDLEEVLNE